MPSYHFSLGNSTDGPIGFCARVTAGNQVEALEYLKQALECISREYKIASHMLSDGQSAEIEYIEVYFNPDVITYADIDEVGG